MRAGHVTGSKSRDDAYCAFPIATSDHPLAAEIENRVAAELRQRGAKNERERAQQLEAERERRISNLTQVT